MRYFLHGYDYDQRAVTCLEEHTHRENAQAGFRREARTHNGPNQELGVAVARSRKDFDKSHPLYAGAEETGGAGRGEKGALAGSGRSEEDGGGLDEPPRGPGPRRPPTRDKR